jgi:hypothetical protein
MIHETELFRLTFLKLATCNPWHWLQSIDITISMLSIAALQYCTRSAKKLYSGKKNFF